MLLDKDILLLVVVIVVTESLANVKEGTDSLPGTHKYCGRNLVNVLTIVCDGIYNNQLTPTPKPAGANVFRPKRSVVTIFQRSSIRRRRGAYDECCRKGCSWDEMAGYCGAQSPFNPGPE